jgi:hypothetical protein
VRIYVASSWRNSYQPGVVKALRDAKHEVYDFRNPGDGEKGFGWDSIDPAWKSWSVVQFREALGHPFAVLGFARDKNALEWCQACVLVLPSGMSAHLEAGWCAGQGKPVVIYAPELREAELMYKIFDREHITPIFEQLDDVRTALDLVEQKI